MAFGGKITGVIIGVKSKKGQKVFLNFTHSESRANKLETRKLWLFETESSATNQ